HHKARLTHRGPCGEDDEILQLEAGGELVEAVVAGGDAGEEFSGAVDLLDRDHVRAGDAVEGDEAFVGGALGDLVQRFLGDVEDVRGLGRSVERGAHHAVSHHDEAPQHRLFLDDVRVALDVGDV